MTASPLRMRFTSLSDPLVGLNYLITASIIFFFPFGLFWLDDYLNPPPLGPRYGNPRMGFLIGNLIILLPISLLLQLTFNKILLTSKNKTVEMDSLKGQNSLESDASELIKN
ncbi:MAG: hypothetical protein ACKO7P_04495 [Bacteroidota bacterium]